MNNKSLLTVIIILSSLIFTNFSAFAEEPEDRSARLENTYYYKLRKNFKDAKEIPTINNFETAKATSRICVEVDKNQPEVYYNTGVYLFNKKSLALGTKFKARNEAKILAAKNPVFEMFEQFSFPEKKDDSLLVKYSIAYSKYLLYYFKIEKNELFYKVRGTETGGVERVYRYGYCYYHNEDQ